MFAHRMTWIAAVFVAAACGTARADARPDRPLRVAERPRAPYSLEILDKYGRPLPTFEHRGRFYVLGNVDQRYVIRVANPTDRRVEAVVSVDGLDVIDGRPADLRKRGYVVPARGELRIEGFRVSTREVAAFRFSAVADSYAARKGKPRHVGVIGLAVFEEREPPQVIVDAPPVPDDRRDRYDYDFEDDLVEGELAPPPAAGTGGARHAAPAGADAPAAKTASPRRAPAERCCGWRPRGRPGLGTEFGERRSSPVQWTRFERKNPAVPDAVAELRYNDVDGLRALGIDIAPRVTAAEIETRETADPFPGSRFAEPPR